MTEFTPVASLAGGALIGLSAVLLMAFEGRIAGISGIASRLLPPWSGEAQGGRLGFVLGLVGAPFLWVAATGQGVAQTVSGNLPLMIVAGLLVGFGSVWGSGCTSGHGICGLARLSPRSAVAVAIFMTTALVTVLFTRHVIGG